MTESLRFEGRILSATISRDSVGDWYASFNVEISEDSFVYPHKCESQAFVGVDLGIKTLATCSNGMIFENPKPLAKAQRRLRKRNKALSRKVKGSNNRTKARIHLAKAYRKVTRIRMHHLHNLTSWLVKTFRVIGIEDLNVKGMVKNHKLAKALSDAAFGEFRRQLEYKAKLSGSLLAKADRFFPSSKKCSVCGFKLDSLDLSIREWACPSCGVFHDRDLNAAKNLELVAREYWETLNACGEPVNPKPRKRSRYGSVKQECKTESERSGL
jgi:putative transposase